MKQLVFDKRMELVEICRWAHIEPDNSTTPEKINGLIDAGKFLNSLEINTVL